MSTLNRTYYPKHVSYFGDGAGRDKYVIFNHEGLHTQSNFAMQPRGSVLTLAKNGFMHGVTPRKDETPVDYVPDGSGRDTYII